ncbi:unnamed protein product [Vitrella brassicaformis CCMP3155]|uniref:F-box domain-containing protein n=1 Tax=Vitrella brassicaformis (strain CCMP3155) TaxID=1169540 RepID=A0A0G4FB62_VITBC|nr:unnamed protein product [Vitrella brassicaformis CCMP3155]|eukprot:CEM10113.1 unnamed protein product [Vitrella brassicaformis CCMP3155]
MGSLSAGILLRENEELRKENRRLRELIRTGRSSLSTFELEGLVFPSTLWSPPGGRPPPEPPLLLGTEGQPGSVPAPAQTNDSPSKPLPSTVDLTATRHHGNGGDGSFLACPLDLLAAIFAFLPTEETIQLAILCCPVASMLQQPAAFSALNLSRSLAMTGTQLAHWEGRMTCLTSASITIDGPGSGTPSALRLVEASAKTLRELKIQNRSTGQKRGGETHQQLVFSRLEGVEIVKGGMEVPGGWQLPHLKSLKIHECEAKDVEWISGWLAGTEAVESIHIFWCDMRALAIVLSNVPSLRHLRRLFVYTFVTPFGVDERGRRYDRMPPALLLDALRAKEANLADLAFDIGDFSPTPEVLFELGCLLRAVPIHLSVNRIHLQFLDDLNVPIPWRPFVHTAIRQLARTASCLCIKCVRPSTQHHQDAFALHALQSVGDTSLCFDAARTVEIDIPYEPFRFVPPVLVKSVYPNVKRVVVSDFTAAEPSCSVVGLLAELMRSRCRGVSVEHRCVTAGT